MVSRWEKRNGSARNLAQGGIGCGWLALCYLHRAADSRHRRTHGLRMKVRYAIWMPSGQRRLRPNTWTPQFPFTVMMPSLLAPNAPIASDKQSIHAAWASLLGPDTSLNWQASKVDVARSGDLAYVVGVYEMTTKGPQGTPVTDRGKFVEVWKRQMEDGGRHL